MNLLVKKASDISTEELALLGLTGIPADWPIESLPYTGQDIPGFALMSEEDMAALKVANQAGYTAWASAKNASPIESIIVSTKLVPLEQYLKSMVDLVIAQNIAQQITLAGKSADVLGFFEARILLQGKTREVSLKGALDMKSLYVALDILDYYLARPELYEDLNPFINSDRILWFKSAISAALAS